MEKYGIDNVHIYKSQFNPMYFAVTQHKSPCLMKLICVGEEEKVREKRTETAQKAQNSFQSTKDIQPTRIPPKFQRKQNEEQ